MTASFIYLAGTDVISYTIYVYRFNVHSFTHSFAHLLCHYLLARPFLFIYLFVSSL